MPSQVLHTSHATLARTVGDAIATRLRSDECGPDVDAALAWAEQPGNSIVTLADADVPAAAYSRFRILRCSCTYAGAPSF